VYDRQIDAETTLTLGVSGMLYQNGLIMYDHQTESLWSHILGQGVAGTYEGTQLTFIPALHTTWASWLERHPETLVINPTLYADSDVYDGYYARSDAGVLGRVPDADTRLPTKEFVIGVRLNGQAKAYPFYTLNQEPAVNDHLGEVELAIFFDKTTASGAVFDRQLPDGTILTFEPGPATDIARDTQTGSEWDIFTGQAISGELEGTKLTQIPITYAFWFGWADYHKDGTIYGE